MSIRIHQLSKLLGLENKELIALLQSRGYDIRTASNTVDKITEESLIEEFQKKSAEAAQVVAEEPAVAEVPSPEEEPVKEEESARKPIGAPRLPPGVFVKTTEDIRREKEAKIEAAKAAKLAATPPPPVIPGVRSAPPPPPGNLRTQPPAAPQVRVVPPVARPATPPPPPAVTRPAPIVPPSQATRPQTAPSIPSVRPPATPAKVESVAGAEEESSVPEVSSEGKVIQIKPPIVVRDFAMMLGLKPFRLISELMEMNIFASMNQVIEEEVALKIAERHGFTLEIKHRGENKAPAEQQKKKEEPVDESKFLEPRAPVVCILGHVDHGKTTLMDAIRKSNVASGEYGGITQHIGAYQVEHNGHKITFLDTPGHAAFSKMRERGANLTDVVILVVAADDGFKPQTDEALKFAQKASVPLIVAINKIDSKGANIDRVKQQMQERGIPPEDWGGETIAVPIAAIKGEGISDLLEMIQLQAEIMELKANPKCPSEGVIVETQIETGRGSTCTVIVRRGTLKAGDAIVSGSHYARVRSLINDRGETVRSALPGTPVRVVGWSGNPPSGANFATVKNEREAKNLAEEHEREQKKLAEQQITRNTSLDDLFGSIEAGQKKQFRCVVKADVHGSVEAIVGMLNGIKSDKVDMKVISSEVGIVTKNDILMASTSGACILAFNTKLDNGVMPFAKHHGVIVYQHTIIYQLIDQVTDLMADLLDPELRESKLGAARVRQAFPVAKGVVAGCLVTEGKVSNNSHVRLLRDGKLLTSSRITTLKRFKDDVPEVRAGTECGIRIDRWEDFKEGDILEVFEVTKVKSSL